MASSAFHPDTKINYRSDDALDFIVSLSDLVAQYQAVDKPIIVYSMARAFDPITKRSVTQQAQAVDIELKYIVKERVTITFDNGGTVICTEDTNLNIVQAAETKKIKVSEITGFSYLDAKSLSIGDKILSNNKDGFMAVETIAKDTTSFEEYFGLSVPVFGNFYLEILGTDGTYTSIVAGN